MDFWGTILILFRRWYIALPAFLLAAGLAGAVFISQPIRYTSTSVLVLTAPAAGATQRADPRYPPDLTNPLLNFDDGLNDTAAILVHALSAPETAVQFGVSPSSDPTYQVTNGTSNPELLINGPFIVINGQSTSPGKAQGLVVQVAQHARQELIHRQQELKAPPSTYITLSQVVPPTTPQTERRSRLRPAASALALGAITGIAAVFGAESIMTRQHRRWNAGPAAGAPVRAGASALPVEDDVAQAGNMVGFSAQLLPDAAVRNGDRRD